MGEESDLTALYFFLQGISSCWKKKKKRKQVIYHATQNKTEQDVVKQLGKHSFYFVIRKEHCLEVTQI